MSRMPARTRDLTTGERVRLLAGRHDWREEDWQDHCGEDCDTCHENGAWIPDGTPHALPMEEKVLRSALICEQKRKRKL